MKAAGLLLLTAGFAIVAATLTLLPAAAAQAGFALAGVAVQLAGLGLCFRAHYTLTEGQR